MLNPGCLFPGQSKGDTSMMLPSHPAGNPGRVFLYASGVNHFVEIPACSQAYNRFGYDTF